MGARSTTPTRDLVRPLLADPDEPMPWALVRFALASTARLAVVPAQDLLGLGSEARMNTPGIARATGPGGRPPGAFDAALADRLRERVVGSDR